ncbi:UPF0688 protein C1orf174 homolog [Suncus etruscus]|uniref:UPF0688 protein C1orf174 homolog n=1 Tax=Suncus etruscus TaxID=109475 RepID=UPI00210F4926|nr:UPF0688 protein C1orf174 homolog [Suncus etruscus]
MRSRKLAVGLRASARLHARSCSARLSSSRDVPRAAPARPECQPASSRRTPKRFKADRGHQGKAQLQRVAQKSPGTPRVPPKARCSSEHRDLPKAGNGAAAEATGLFPELGTESQACLGEQGTQSPLVHLDPDVYLDDSSQPLPVSCFFGNVELMQDLPPASSACPSMSRREFRKLHFRAKDDDEEDEDAAEM